MNKVMIEYEEKNYYELLGVEADSSSQEIKAAYRQLALIFHPDSNHYCEIIDDGMSERSNQIFRCITRAYETLSDSRLRKEYDRQNPPPKKNTENEESFDGFYNPDVDTEDIPERRFGVIDDRDSAFDSLSSQEIQSMAKMMWHNKTLLDHLLLLVGIGLPVASLTLAIIYLI